MCSTITIQLYVIFLHLVVISCQDYQYEDDFSTELPTADDLNNTLPETPEFRRTCESSKSYYGDVTPSWTDCKNTPLVCFYLFTRETEDNHQQISFRYDAKLEEFRHHLNSRREFLIGIHEWREDAKGTLHGYPATPFNIANAPLILRKLNVNLIIADWSPLADFITIGRTKRDQAAKIIKTWIARVVKAGIAKPCQFHLVGYSAGAAVAGLVGRKLAGDHKIRIRRITCLDPTRSFATVQKNDAEFVTCIHSGGHSAVGWISDEWYQNGYGDGDKLGHVDFYINGGSSEQPGCSWSKDYCDQIKSADFFNEFDRIKFGTLCEQLHHELHWHQKCLPKAVRKTRMIAGYYTPPTSDLSYDKGKFIVKTGRLYPLVKKC